ncbi:60S ribosomal protein L22 [Candidatus Bathyarchaeota archaeon]|nr:60S ribosomal protein L22 [Candidatus Bathyarchaeota archaeon]
MSELRIDIAELSKEDENYAELLADFLRNRINVALETSKEEATLTFEEGEESLARRKRIRQLLKKFLHKRNLKEDFRVISGGEGSFIIKGRRKRELE